MRHHSSVARREGPPYLLVLRRILAYAGCVAVNSVKYASHRLTSLPTEIRRVSKQTSMFGRVLISNFVHRTAVSIRIMDTIRTPCTTSILVSKYDTFIQLSSGPKVSACLIGTSNHKRRNLEFLRAKPADKDELPERAGRPSQ